MHGKHYLKVLLNLPRLATMFQKSALNLMVFWLVQLEQFPMDQMISKLSSLRKIKQSSVGLCLYQCPRIPLIQNTYHFFSASFKNFAKSLQLNLVTKVVLKFSVKVLHWWLKSLTTVAIGILLTTLLEMRSYLSLFTLYRKCFWTVQLKRLCPECFLLRRILAHGQILSKLMHLESNGNHMINACCICWIFTLQDHCLSCSEYMTTAFLHAQQNEYIHWQNKWMN